VDPLKVLVADDSPLVLRMFQRLLGEAGYQVLPATDGLEAVERAFSEEVDLIVLDVMMPRMNGYLACRLLKSEPATRGVPVVMLTSRSDAGDRFWGLETGADFYVTKDSPPERILELVRNTLSGQRTGSQRAVPRRGTSTDILARVNELLDRKLFEATILSEIGRVARSLDHFDETFASVMAVVTRVVDYSVGALAFVEADEAELMLMLNRPVSPEVTEEVKAKLLETISRERGADAITRVQVRLTSGPEADRVRRTETTLGGFTALPVRSGERLSGLLALAGRAVPAAVEEASGFLAQVANQAHIVTENSRLFDRVKNLSIRDGLTGLFNHRHTMEVILNEFERASRYSSSLSVLMIDIDHFKRVNDESGHLAGDAVLREVARLLRDALRTVDFVGRYGGEEFLAILPHTSEPDARLTAERLRSVIEQHEFRSGSKSFRVTVSIGVASHPDSAAGVAAELVRVADEALYRAKDRGRNCVA
jgi:two-component system, cell cycle response regulator